jgi:6-phosphogluconate dehydrogenase
MGHSLALNAAEHRFLVSAFDRDPEKTKRLAGARPQPSLERLVASLPRPRAVLLMVPAGPAVDAVIADLMPQLSPGDLVIDGGNSFFRDTERRGEALSAKGLRFMGLGISGGERGAREGASLMPGGDREDYERLRPLFEALAARVDGAPCVTYLGRGSAGHYVKMVHNGIEYAVMQLIAETYDLMRRGLGLGDDDLAAVYERWNEGSLASYLLEITARVLRVVDERTGQRLVHLIVDRAGQKGTGRWSSQDAMELGVPVLNIDVAVSLRELSGLEEERRAAARLFAAGQPRPPEGERVALERLRRAYELGVMVAYAQGLAQLREASGAYRYGLDLGEIARIWRGGCIIRAALLEQVQAIYAHDPQLSHLLLDAELSRRVVDLLPDLRATVSQAAALGIPAPGLMTALAYLDALRSPRLPTNLIQAQRDCFGGHGFARIDAEGTFHSRWGEEREPEASHAR